ncbi:DUF262 domain-containing HNH endonuclease family protein [Anoxybacillus salavatliensis]|uniref:DUF262 domain-containing protein n=1 Tax=Anoxybacillus gonensis TaxID=198467 RepID=UPI00214CF8BC|nr:DUF262 domain-containing HNH endonuclease family protein [Anoxybacillus gonensis]MCQ5365889.1 DUF262 domain-containing HNH endonuclease family protein [Anoxybacillus gonensis]
MRTTLNAQEMPLHKIFSDDFLFTIPSVQRPYSWTIEQAGELLDDLLEFIEHHGITEKNIEQIPEPYFLGSIVLVKGEKPEAEILDGQQRLTTLTILLSALRSYLPSEYADEIDDLIVQKGSRIRKIEDTYRLQLRKKDNPFFRKYIQEREGITKLTDKTEVKTDSQALIRNNALYYLERFNDLDESILTTLPSVIATLCYMVVVSTPNFDSAFRIFTVLNDRGLDLMVTDILKAKIIGKISEDEQEIYTEKWEDIESSLGREQFNELFSHIRMILQKRKGAGNLKDEYESILENFSGKKFIDEVLVPYSDIYMKIKNYRTEFAGDEEAIKILEFLNRIDNVDWIPVAMYYMFLNDEKISEFLKCLERFAASHIILRKNFNWRQSKYSTILRELEQGKSPFSEDSTLNLTKEEKKEVIEALNGDVYKKLKDAAKRYVLLRLDSLLSKGQPYYNYSVVTIEHILPQNPPKGSEWTKNFPNIEQYVHKLGNLVLLTVKKNSRAKNFDFQRKKSTYFQLKDGISTFALTTQVIREKEWTPEVLERRQKLLVNLLIKEWRLE